MKTTIPAILLLTLAAAYGTAYADKDSSSSTNNLTNHSNIDLTNRNSMNNDIDITNRNINYNDITNRNINNNSDYNMNLNHSKSNSDSYSSSGSSSRSDQSQDQSQSQSQHQSATSNNSNQVQGSSSNSGHNSTTVNNVQAKQIHNTPSMPLFVPAPTSPCIVNYGGSAAGAGFGFALSGGITNENCEQIELSKALAQIGMVDASLEMLCKTKHAVKEGLAACKKYQKVSRETMTATDETPVTGIQDTPGGERIGYIGKLPVRYDRYSREWVSIY